MDRAELRLSWEQHINAFANTITYVEQEQSSPAGSPQADRPTLLWKRILEGWREELRELLVIYPLEAQGGENR